MKPVLFDSGATEFTTNGIGRLDPTSCVVTETRNGSFELKLVCSITGPWAKYLNYRCIICAKPSPSRKPQPFRIYRIVKSISGLVTVYARHISYDLSYIVLQPFDATSLSDAFSKFWARASTPCPFYFKTDFTKIADFTIEEPTSIRSVMGDSEGGILAVYGGEYEWDTYNVFLHAERGTHRSTVLRYGKNLTSFEQDANCAAVYTGIYPYYINSSGNYTEVDGQIVKAAGTYDFTRILPVDLTSYFTELKEGETPSKDTEFAYGSSPTPAQLLAVARQYLEDNEIGVPTVSIDLNFVQLAQSEEYAEYAEMETVELCDWVTVVFPEMNVSANAQVVSTEFDVLTERYTSIKVGNANTDFLSTIGEFKAQTLQSIKQTREKLESSITQTAENITLYVGKELENYAKKELLQSSINQSAEAITLYVSKTYVSGDALTDTLSGYYTKSETNSAIEQKADSITSTVSATYAAKVDVANDISAAQTAAVSSANSATDEKLKSYTTISQFNSTIEQLPNQILLQVSAKYQVQGDYATNSAVNAAQTAANNAASAASTAQSTANSASSAAATAQSTANSKVSQGNVRSSFASESSSISITSGTITFETGTIVINAANFKVDASGNLQFSGSIYNDGGGGQLVARDASGENTAGWNLRSGTFVVQNNMRICGKTSGDGLSNLEYQVHMYKSGKWYTAYNGYVDTATMYGLQVINGVLCTYTQPSA